MKYICNKNINNYTINYEERKAIEIWKLYGYNNKIKVKYLIDESYESKEHYIEGRRI